MDQSEAQRGHMGTAVPTEPMGTAVPIPSQAAAQPAIPLQVLQDRYDGLLMNLDGKPAHENQTQGMVGDYNRLQLKLDFLLSRLLEGTARTGADNLQGHDFVGELEAMIRDQVVRRLHETGVAR